MYCECERDAHDIPQSTLSRKPPRASVSKTSSRTPYPKPTPPTPTSSPRRRGTRRGPTLVAAATIASRVLMIVAATNFAKFPTATVCLPMLISLASVNGCPMPVPQTIHPCADVIINHNPTAVRRIRLASMSCTRVDVTRTSGLRRGARGWHQ